MTHTLWVANSVQSKGMDPTFKTIADLFAVPILPDEPPLAIERRKKDGRNEEESRQLGRQSLTDGDFETAIRHFTNAVEQAGDHSTQARIDLAGAYEYGDQYPQAFRQFERALKEGEVAEPHVGAADLLKKYGRFRDSVERILKAIEVEPKNPFFHIKLSELYREMGEPNLALSAARQAVLCKPDEAFYYYWIGDLLTHLKRFDEALDSLRAAIELSPGDDFLYLRAAVAFWKAKRPVEAIKSVRLASDLDPDKHLYHGLLGILLEESKQMDEARLESARASKMDRYDHDLLGRLMDEMGIEV